MFRTRQQQGERRQRPVFIGEMDVGDAGVALGSSDDNVVYTIFKYMNVDNRILGRARFPCRLRPSHHDGGSPKGDQTAVLRLCRYHINRDQECV